MSPFGWGILLGGFGVATVLAFYHKGLATHAVIATLAWAVVMTAIPNHWVGMGRKHVIPRNDSIPEGNEAKAGE